MSGFRWEIEASAGPAREGTIGGCARLLVRVRLFNEPDETGPTDKPDAFTDLRTDDARHLAFELLAAAEHAEHLSRHNDNPEPQQ
ncbi:MAG: hypothetical protein M3P44_00765 [Actinomycetota bacterium]|nr:hypothetical protein [Actinomycetota bacterium]